jgi:hypothetical protein
MIQFKGFFVKLLNSLDGSEPSTRDPIAMDFLPTWLNGGAKVSPHLGLLKIRAARPGVAR